MKKSIYQKINQLFNDIHTLLTVENGIGEYGSLSLKSNGVKIHLGLTPSANSDALDRIKKDYLSPQDIDSQIILGICQALFSTRRFSKSYFYEIGLKNPLSYCIDEASSYKKLSDTISILKFTNTQTHDYCLAFCEMFLNHTKRFPKKLADEYHIACKNIKK